MEKIKERLEREKAKLEIFKHNLLCFKDDFHIKEHFFIEKETVGNSTYYDISQNISSLFFLLATFQYPDPITCFFIEAFNFYQDLPKRSNYPYRSCSQGLTTYYLREFARNQIINLISSQKSHKIPLTAYMKMLGNYDHKNKEVQMYYSYFYKKRNLNKKDIPMIKNIAHILNIDVSNLKIISKNSKIYLRMNNKYKFYQLLTGENFKKIYAQKEIIYSMLKEYGDYLFDRDSGRKKIDKPILKLKKSLYNKNTRRN